MADYQKIHRLKIRIILFVFIMFAIGTVMMLLRWQILDNEQFIAIANERYQDKRIPALRGSILANDGTSLAFSEPRFDVYVWLPEVELAESRGFQSKQEFISTVAGILDKSEKEIEKILNSGPLWIKLSSRITVDKRDRLLDAKLEGGQSLQGIQFEYVNKRVYPDKRLASHILGFVGSNTNGELVGVSGLEQYWEGSLRPQEGFESGEFDSFGNLITIADNKPLEPKPGVTIYTTIDKTLQTILEKNLKAGVINYQALSATGIIMNPKTGEIMAMANYPDFNPNRYFDENNGEVFGNRAITIPYEIGSVAKVFTIAAAIDLKTIQSSTLVLPQGHNGCEIITPNPHENAQCFNYDVPKEQQVDCICTYDKKAVREPISATDALVTSDNIALRHIALTMTYNEFYTYLDRFGVGTPTNIELSGESIGILKDADQWNYADQAVYSYGHSYQLTPLQTITAVAAVANDGKRMQPIIVSKVIEADDKELDFNPTIIEDVIKPKTAKTVTEMMHEVYKSSLVESEYQPLREYYVAMKSGTALIPYRDRAGYSDKFNATYVGFDATPEKKFVMLIKLEAPSKGDLSFYNARKVWLDTFAELKDYMGITKYYKN